MSEPILDVREVEKRFAGVHALQGASFSLFAGEVHALMGENGAGKSTLAKVIAGSVMPDRARFLIDGNPVVIGNPREAQSLGISMIYQELDLFPHLTIAENLAIGNPQFKDKIPVRLGNLDSFAEPVLRQVGLNCSPRRQIGSLSTGEKQLVAIARSLSMNARIIIMDEPTSSLFDDSVERLFELIAALKKNGIAIVYVSHKMSEIFRICDRVTVMRDGQTIGTRLVQETNVSELVRMMIGKEWRAAERKAARSHDEVLLSFDGVTTSKLKNISFSLRKGEVLGIAGLLGSGRSEIGAALLGVDRITNGRITLRGKLASNTSIRKAFDSGIRWLPEDRKLDGLMMRMSILENATIADLASMSTFGFISGVGERKSVVSSFAALSMKASSVDRPVETLSGGNQQKVLIARCLLSNPDLLFLDDPTRGIDVGAKEDIYGIIEQLAAQGKGILLVSSELPELLRCCDRILVMREGATVAELDTANTTQEDILTLATHAGGHA